MISVVSRDGLVDHDPPAITQMLLRGEVKSNNIPWYVDGMLAYNDETSILYLIPGQEPFRINGVPIYPIEATSATRGVFLIVNESKLSRLADYLRGVPKDIHVLHIISTWLYYYTDLIRRKKLPRDLFGRYAAIPQEDINLIAALDEDVVFGLFDPESQIIRYITSHGEVVEEKASIDLPQNGNKTFVFKDGKRKEYVKHEGNLVYGLFRSVEKGAYELVLEMPPSLGSMPYQLLEGMIVAISREYETDAFGNEIALHGYEGPGLYHVDLVEKGDVVHIYLSLQRGFGERITAKP